MLVSPVQPQNTLSSILLKADGRLMLVSDLQPINAPSSISVTQGILIQQRFSQPLSGMIAGKKEVLKKLIFEKDYGVDIGILIDIANMDCSMEEVKIGKLENKSKDWKALDKMATEVMRAILKRRNIG